MADKKIRVGLIGAGGWAKYGHIPALKSLDAFEIVAVSSRTMDVAKATAKEFGIPQAYDKEQDLIRQPDIDLIVILAPGPEHARLAKAVIAAGKDLYCEWPLSTTTAESKALLALAEAKGVRHVIGLQRRFGPSARYTRDLVRQGYVGKIRSARMTVSVDAFPPTMPAAFSWSFDVASFSNTLSIYAGHFCDMLFTTVGFPTKLTAVVKNQFPLITIAGADQKVPTTRPDEAVVIGTLENGGLFSVQIEGAQPHRTGLQIDITGTEGVLKISNVLAFQNEQDNLIEGMKGEKNAFSPLPVPAEYQFLADAKLDVSVQDVAYLYSAYAQDKKNGTSTASNFNDAIRQHELIDRMFETSKIFLA